MNKHREFREFWTDNHGCITREKPVNPMEPWIWIHLIEHQAIQEERARSAKLVEKLSYLKCECREDRYSIVECIRCLAIKEYEGTE